MNAFRSARRGTMMLAKVTAYRQLSSMFVSARPTLRTMNTIDKFPGVRCGTSPPLLRNYSVLTQPNEARLYKYEDVKDLVKDPSKHSSSVLVDVREPIEFHDGHIPGALNIPFKSSPGALDLSPEEFEDHFGFVKPSKENELVFYCLGGVRSTAAEELAQTFGYKKRGNYVGSYEDWSSRENEKK